MLAGRADSRCARRSLTKLSDIGSVDSQHVGAALAGERRWALSEDEQLQLYEKEKGLLGLFVVGAPASMTYNIETGRGLVNGCDATILAHAGQRRERRRQGRGGAACPRARSARPSRCCARRVLA